MNRLELRGSAASPAEAAAAIAAVEQFVRDTAPAELAQRAAQPNPWLRAALLEGVSRDSSRQR